MFRLVLLYITFSSILTAQFGIENWLHNKTNIEPLGIKNNYINIYNLSNITFISNDNANATYSTVSGVEKKINLKNKNYFIIGYNNCKERFLYNYEYVRFNYYQQNNYINTSFYIKRFKNIFSELSFSINNQNKYKYNVNLKVFLADNVYFTIGSSENNYLYNISISQKSEYLYDVINISKNKIDYYSSIGWSIDNFHINLMYNNSVNKILNKMNHTRNIDSPFNDKNIYRIKIDYLLKNNKKISLMIKSTENSFSSIFNANNDMYILKVNRLEYNSDKISFKLHSKKNNKKITYAIEKMNVYYLMSSRIRADQISNSLVAILGAPIINNYNNGYMSSNRIYVVYQKIFDFKERRIHFSYIYDKFNIDHKTTLISSFGIPLSIDFNKFKYKNKKAIIIGFGIKRFYKKLIIDFMFNQHIPFVLKKWNKELTGEDNGSSNIEGLNGYFGGQLFFNLSIKIN